MFSLDFDPRDTLARRRRRSGPLSLGLAAAGVVGDAAALALVSAVALSGCSGEFTITSETDTAPVTTTMDPVSTTDDSTTSGSSTSDGPYETSGQGTGESASASASGTESGGGDMCDGAGVQLGDQVICCGAMIEWPSGLEASTISLQVTVNGEPFVSDAYDDGDIFLVNRATGDRVALGSVQEGTVSAEVFPGSYDVVYEAPPFPKILPRNASAVIYEGLAVPSDEPPAINIAVVDVSAEVSLDGGAPPQKAYDSGQIFFVDKESGARTLVGRTSAMVDGKFKTRLIPGIYDVNYGAETVQGQLPINSDARLVADIEVHADGSLSTPTLAIKTLQLNGDLMLAGEVLPKAPYNRAFIHIEDSITGARTRILDSELGGFNGVRVIDGDAYYGLFYEVAATQGVAPSNQWARLDTPGVLGVDGPITAAQLKEQAASLSLPLISVAGAVTVDMAPFDPDPNNHGELLVVQGDDRAVIGEVQAGIDARLIASAYGVFFRHDVSDGGLPVNTQAELGQTIADEDLALAVDIKTATISGTLTINGSEPPGSIYDDGRIFLRNAAGDNVFLGRTRDGEFSRKIVVGTYDVYYAVESSQGGVPANHDVLLKEGLQIGGDVAGLTIDVPKINFVESVPVKGSGVGHFYLREINTGDEVRIGGTGDDMLSAPLVPSDYLLIYRGESPGAGTPENQGQVLGCYHINGGE